MKTTAQRPIFFVLFTLLCVNPLIAQDTFKGLIPFLTTRAEVEKILGKPTEGSRYELDDGRVYIFYRETSSEPPAGSCYSLVPADTILSITFQPYSDIRVEELKLDSKEWRRRRVSGDHVAGLEVYVNKKSGITYELDRDGFVDAIVYREAEGACQMLKKSPASN